MKSKIQIPLRANTLSVCGNYALDPPFKQNRYLPLFLDLVPLVNNAEKKKKMITLSYSSDILQKYVKGIEEGTSPAYQLGNNEASNADSLFKLHSNSRLCLCMS